MIATDITEARREIGGNIVSMIDSASESLTFNELKSLSRPLHECDADDLWRGRLHVERRQGGPAAA